MRSINDCVLAHSEGEQLVRAVREARERGWLTDDLLPTQASDEVPRRESAWLSC